MSAIEREIRDRIETMVARRHELYRKLSDSRYNEARRTRYAEERVALSKRIENEWDNLRTERCLKEFDGTDMRGVRMRAHRLARIAV